MDFHKTPIELAQALSRHAPKKIVSILDPSVGEGHLLAPFIKRLKSTAKKVICIDTNQDRLDIVKAKYQKTLGRALRIIREDFIIWSGQTKNYRSSNQFDCVVMNPPFAGKKSDWLTMDLAHELPGIGEGVRALPLEAVFVLRAIKLLKSGGRLLSIVPSSIISSTSTLWFRKYLLQLGAVRYVHELPEFTFPGVEARVYLLIFEKKQTQDKLLLCNHDLITPEKLTLQKADLLRDTRFDFNFHQAFHSLQNMRDLYSNLEWKPLKDLVMLHRGSVKSPEGTKVALHTSDYHDGFWQCKDPDKVIHKKETDYSIRSGDLLLKRVGRGASHSLGAVIDHIGYACSDCLLIIRPKDMLLSEALLFTLRIFISSDFGTHLIEKGTGATYITETELRELTIPTKLVERYPIEFAQYKNAINKRDFNLMMLIEKKIRLSLV